MSYVKVDSSVPRNPKFLRAGAAASWLWLCGLAYCQEGLTDGFIPIEALYTLGILSKEQPEKLAARLVTARLWDECDGGWTVHDYLEHNRSGEEVREIKARRAEGGKKGGRKPSSETLKAPLEVNLPRNERLTSPETFPVVVDVAAAEVAAVVKEESARETKFDEMFWRLHHCYPEKRRTSGPITEQLFVQQFQADTRKPDVVFAEMLANLDTQIDGHEWRVKGMVPKLEKWLRDGLWRQRHEVAPVSELVNEKTSRTMASAAEFIKAGQRGA